MSVSDGGPDANTQSVTVPMSEADSEASCTCGTSNSTSYTCGHCQRDATDRERCNPKTCADDSHARSS
jgi:hypothetical protein